MKDETKENQKSGDEININSPQNNVEKIESSLRNSIGHQKKSPNKCSPAEAYYQDDFFDFQDLFHICY